MDLTQVDFEVMRRLCKRAHARHKIRLNGTKKKKHKEKTQEIGQGEQEKEQRQHHIGNQISSTAVQLAASAAADSDASKVPTPKALVLL